MFVCVAVLSCLFVVLSIAALFCVVMDNWCAEGYVILRWLQIADGKRSLCWLIFPFCSTSDPLSSSMRTLPSHPLRLFRPCGNHMLRCFIKGSDLANVLGRMYQAIGSFPSVITYSPEAWCERMIERQLYRWQKVGRWLSADTKRACDLWILSNKQHNLHDQRVSGISAGDKLNSLRWLNSHFQ